MSTDQAIAAMLKSSPDDLNAVYEKALAHEQTPARVDLAISLLRSLYTFPERFGVQPLKALTPDMDVVAEISQLPGAQYKELALVAAQFGLFKAEKPFDEVPRVAESSRE